MSNFLPSITVGELREIIKRQFTAGLQRPIFALGKGGIGKTESIGQLAEEELGIGFVDIRLLLYSETDLKGIPFVNQEHSHTIWLQNDILPRVERDGEQGILLLDEVTSCSKSVRTATYQLLNERCLGEYHLPSGWQVVCLGNGEEDGGQFTGLEGNFADRCAVFQVVADLDSWKGWALTAQIHPFILAYLTWCPQHLHTYDPEKEEFVFASPRSWKAVSDILFLFPHNDPLTMAQIQSNIGTSVGRSFLAFCKMEEKKGEIGEIFQGNLLPPPKSREALLMMIQGILFQLLAQKKNPLTQSEEWLSSLVHGVNWILSLEKVEQQMLGMKELLHSQILAQEMRTEAFTKACPKLMAFAQEHKGVLASSF